MLMTLAAPTAAAKPVASAVTAGPVVQKIGAALRKFVDTAGTWAAGLPTGPVKDFLSGALLLARRALDTIIGPPPNSGPTYLFNLHFLNTTDQTVYIYYSVDEAYLAGTPEDQHTGITEYIDPGGRIEPRFDTKWPTGGNSPFTFTICSIANDCASHAEFSGTIDWNDNIYPEFTSSSSSFPGYPKVFTREADGYPWPNAKDPSWKQDPAVISIGIPSS